MGGRQTGEQEGAGGGGPPQTLSALSWTQSEWLEQAHAWIGTQLDSRGIATVGAISEFHVPPWTTVMRVPTGEGNLYFKASVPLMRLRDFTPRFSALCEGLATGEIPPALHHDDFHDGNIFVHEGRYIFTDWGEAFVAHPFFTLLVTLRSIAHTLDLDAGDPVLTALCELYLGARKQFAPLDRLQKIFPLAQHAGKVCRALTWYVVGSELTEPERTTHLDAVIFWLREVLAMVKRKGKKAQRA